MPSLLRCKFLNAASGNAARCLGLNGLGTLTAGNWADFIVLNEDPLADIKKHAGASSRFGSRGMKCRVAQRRIARKRSSRNALLK